MYVLFLKQSPPWPAHNALNAQFPGRRFYSRTVLIISSISVVLFFPFLSNQQKKCFVGILYPCEVVKKGKEILRMEKYGRETWRGVLATEDGTAQAQLRASHPRQGVPPTPPPSLGESGAAQAPHGAGATARPGTHTAERPRGRTDNTAPPCEPAQWGPRGRRGPAEEAGGACSQRQLWRRSPRGRGPGTKSAPDSASHPGGGVLLAMGA